MLCRLTALSSLSIRGSEGLDMPNIGSLTQLRKLMLQHSYPGDVVAEPPLAQLILLQELTVQEYMVALPIGLSGLTQLTSFTLVADNIVGVLPALRQLPRLRRFACLFDADLANHIGSMLRGATTITSLELDARAEQQFPLLPAVTTLSNLLELQLHYSNSEAAWPAGMTRLSRLTRLTLTSHQMPRLPTDVTTLRRLRALRLRSSTKLCESVTRLRLLERVVGSNEYQDDAEHFEVLLDLAERGVGLYLNDFPLCKSLAYGL
jgi:Leucine-rich repeat (LRR) protein